MSSVICRTLGHKVNRRRVWHDGLEFRTTCDRCDAGLIRGRDGWREFDDEIDADESRQPHPNFNEA